MLWSLVMAWMVVIRARRMPKFSCSTLATGASALVVQLALEMTCWVAGSYFSSLTPRTNVPSMSLSPGEEMMTFLAPPVR